MSYGAGTYGSSFYGDGTTGIGAASSGAYASLSVAKALVGSASSGANVRGVLSGVNFVLAYGTVFSGSGAFATLSVSTALTATGPASSGGYGMLTIGLPVAGAASVGSGASAVLSVTLTASGLVGSGASAVLFVAPPIIIPPPKTFIPPTLLEVTPLGDPMFDKPLGCRLMRFYQPRPRGVMVAKMSDGSYRIARQVPGLVGGPPVLEVWPALQAASTIDGTPYQVNNTIARGYSGYSPGVIVFDFPQVPAVTLVYNGGHVYTVSDTEAQALTAAGLGAYVH